MNQTDLVLEFRWASALGVSVVLFLLSGILHILIGILTPLAVDSEFSRRILMISNRADSAFFGIEPTQLLQQTPELVKLRTVLSRVIGGWLITIGMFTVAVTWFGLRNFQTWSLFTLAGSGAVLALFWILAIRQYLQADVHIQVAELPPIFWIPAATLVPAIILGWVGLR